MGKSKRNLAPPKPEESKVLQQQRFDGPAKIGPGMVLAIEEFGEPGTADAKKRVRNHGEHPLTAAFHRGQLVTKYPADVQEKDQITAHERLAAGEQYRVYFEKIGRSGRDSTDINIGGGGSGTPWTQEQAIAIKELEKIERRMHHRDVTIIRKFCGEAYSMVDALRAARIDFHPNGVTYRIREALDDLVSATTGKRIIPTPLDPR